MEIALTAYTIPLWVVAVVGTGLAALTAYYHEQKGAYALFAVFVGAVFWAGGYAMEFSATSPQAAIFWYKIRFLGSTIVPTAIFLIALRFTDRDHLITTRNVAVLAVMPVVTNLLLFTSHPLWVRASNQFIYDPSQSAVVQLMPNFGPWFLVYAYYSLAIAVVAIGMLAQQVLERSDESWINTTSAFLAATILPTAGTAVYVVNISQIDYGPFAFLISGLCIMAAMFYL